MPARHFDLHPVGEPIAELHALREEMKVPLEFPREVTEAAERAASQAGGSGGPALEREDRSDLEFVTIDPDGAKDLDQALAIERDGDGFVVWYAIADVAAFVSAGDPIDVEARRRGQTLYAPDRRIPLHPPALSEAAASLLPGQAKPAVLWKLTLDSSGELAHTEVRRALVRSKEQLTYEQAQQHIDDGSASESLQLLKVVGQLREQIEAQRGGISLSIPEQEVDTSSGEWKLVFRSMLAVEGWNAQISLLTGIAAAQIMLAHKIGIVRTLPPAEERAVRRLRHTARALKLVWPDGQSYPEFVRSLDPAKPADVAMLNACTTLFRGAGYTAFAGSLPEQTEHAALATPYAHCTAPLRRLVDRWASEIVLALSAGTEVPAWVRDSMDSLPAIMAESDQHAKKYERAVIDLIEAQRLKNRVGESFTGVVVDLDDRGGAGRIMISDPAVEAKVVGDNLPLGEEVSVVLTKADPATRTVEFRLS